MHYASRTDAQTKANRRLIGYPALLHSPVDLGITLRGEFPSKPGARRTCVRSGTFNVNIINNELFTLHPSSYNVSM